jgi:tRNA/tmRNA/rRNA uracil-C5-methylase (TrmA/RlmC/RlmD family)
MLESFYIQTYSEKVERDWKLKHALGCEIFGKDSLRSLRPDLVADRSRLDLMWMNNILGIRGPQKSSNDFEFFHLKAPETAQAPILEMMEALERDPLPIPMAQLRFRIASSGERGLWIDCANTMIRDLLAQKHWLCRRLSEGWIVEVGQKHKAVFEENGELSLKESEALSWLDSYNHFNEALPLLSHVSSFSQPGPEANRALIAAIFDLLDHHNVFFESWAEWGAGYGNLSAAIASLGAKTAWSSELDPVAAELLARNAQNHFPFVDCVQEAATIFHQNVDLALMDPPRSGFPQLLGTLREMSEKPRFILAIHCHTKGLHSDIPLLRENAYSLLDWSSADIFPGTSYQEHISLWTRP